MKSQKNIEVSKDGIKLSFTHFIADSSSGFVLILVALLGYWNKLPILFFGAQQWSLIPRPFPTEGALFIALVAVLLATPIGLCLNAASWFFLGIPQIFLIGFWARIDSIVVLNYITRPTTLAFNFEKSKSSFDLNYSGLKIYEAAKVYEDIFKMTEDSLMSELEHIRAIKNFLRAVALICLASVVIFWDAFTLKYSAAMFIAIGIGLVLKVAMIEFHQCLKILNRVRLISDVHNTELDIKTFASCLTSLKASDAQGKQPEPVTEK